MRLLDRERKVIADTIRGVDPRAQLFLFGSRARDDARGGDIDILCISSAIDRRQRRQIRRSILDQIGEQKLDLVVESNAEKPFVRLILRDAEEIK